MPICQLKTNAGLSENQKSEFTETLADELSVILEKPLPAVMVMISDEYMMMNKSDDTVVFCEFRYVKDYKDADDKACFLKKFSDRMLEVIQQFTKVDPYRIYMQFTEMPRDGAWRYIPDSNKKG